MKTALKVIGGIFCLGLIGGGIAFYATANITKAADEFFTAVADRNFPKALALTSSEFRAATPQPEFVAFLERTSLARFKSVSWQSRSVSPGKGELEGTVSTQDGGSIPLKLVFVKENGDWHIYAFEKLPAGVVAAPRPPGSPPAGAAAATGPPSAPVEAAPGAPGEATKAEPAAKGSSADSAPSVPPVPGNKGRFLVKVTMSKVATAAEKGDVRMLAGTRGSAAETEACHARLKSELKSIGDQKIDLSSLVREEPVLNGAPVVDKNGKLVLSGYYPTRPARVSFRLTFLGRGDSWLLDDLVLSKP